MNFLKIASDSGRRLTSPSSTASLIVLAGALLFAGSAAVAQSTDAAPAAQAVPALSADASSSSSSTNNSPLLAEGSTNPLGSAFANAMQYGGGQRSRYGRPRYRGGNTNADGSAKYTFEAGAGLTQPLGNTYKYFTPSYGFQVGGGRNFNKSLGLLVQFDYDHFGLTRSALGNESYLYTGDSNAADNGIDANNHTWSFSLNPVYTVFQGSAVGAYAVVGVGFYHKVTNFTAPQSAYYCTYYGCGVVGVQSNFDHYTSNAPGFNGGFGLTYKFSRFSNERFFGEVRYVFVDNSQRTGITVNNVNTAYGQNYTGSDYFPANSNRTTYVPIKFGVRF